MASPHQLFEDLSPTDVKHMSIQVMLFFCLTVYSKIMKSISVRIPTGLLVVAAGLAFLLSNLNILAFGDLIGNWWPLVIIIAGTLIFLDNAKNYLWALLVAGFGTILQLQQLDIIDVNPWQLIWPAIIIVVGLSIIFSRNSPKSRVGKSDREDVTAVLGGSEANIRSQDFKGSRVTSVMGGAVIDLRHAKIEKEATLDLFSLWGGIEIRLPKDIVVKNETSVILGGVEDITDNTAEKNAPVLHIIGDIIMAGVEIKN